MAQLLSRLRLSEAADRPGVGLPPHVQDNRIVKVTSPFDHDVTRGTLCVKGRFGWAYVQAPEG